MNPLFIAGAQATRHAIMRTVSVLCVLAIIGLLGLGVKRILYPRPTESYAQRAKEITNIEHHNYYDSDSRFFLGLKIWGFKFGISKMEPREVKKEATKLK